MHDIELELLADVGLVSAPNMGRSKLLHDLMAGQAHSTVAG
jgi:GTPase involved in cell partitioning and DNA repair